MKEKLIRFMQGRYGVDQLSKTLLAVSFVFVLLSSFTGVQFFYWMFIMLAFYSYFRVFSKNTCRRYEENQKYMKYHNKVKYYFISRMNLMKQRKIYHIYKCPSCKQKIRIPKGKGKIMVRCPKCRTEFVKKS